MITSRSRCASHSGSDIESFAERDHRNVRVLVLDLDPVAKFDLAPFHPRTHEIAGAFDRMLTGGSQVWELLSFVVDRLGVIVYVEAKQGHRMVSDW